MTDAYIDNQKFKVYPTILFMESGEVNYFCFCNSYIEYISVGDSHVAAIDSNDYVSLSI